jgi:hypothetical protein
MIQESENLSAMHDLHLDKPAPIDGQPVRPAAQN